MGNESSRPVEEINVDNDGHIRQQTRRDDALEDADGEFCGFRVLGIQEQSPAAHVGFVSFFDFILEANGLRLDSKDSTFMELIAQSEDMPMKLQVYNVKAQTMRELELTPSRAWPGKGLLGVTIRFDSYEGAEDQVLHVLNVAENSPADVAGIRADSDYLLGTPERVFRDTEDLYDEVLNAIGSSFQCYVYNAELDQVRIVSIAPSEQWGGKGVLGAEVAHGYLHRLPTSCRTSIGSSIGFVKLSDDVLAATDPFMKKQRPNKEGAQAPVNTTSSTDNASDSVEDHQKPNTSPPKESAATASQIETVASVSASDDAPDSSLTKANVDSALSGEGSASSDQPPPSNESETDDQKLAGAPRSTKLRYTARTDHRFPISTVEVLADPM